MPVEAKPQEEREELLMDAPAGIRSISDEKAEKGTVRLVFPFKGKGEARIFFPEQLSKEEVGKLIMLLKAYVSDDVEG